MNTKFTLFSFFVLLFSLSDFYGNQLIDTINRITKMSKKINCSELMKQYILLSVHSGSDLSILDKSPTIGR